MRKNCDLIVQKMYTNICFLNIYNFTNIKPVDTFGTFPLFLTNLISKLNTAIFTQFTDKYPFFYTLSTIPIITTTKLNIFIINN